MDNAEVSLTTKQQRALELGREYLGVTNGHIQRQKRDETDDVLVSAGEDPTPFAEGELLDRATTYCRRTVESHSPVALSNVPEQGWDEDPAYKEHGVDCYLGTTIFVDGEVYGTVCFTAPTPRETDFTADEKAFVELVARLLGRAIEAEEHEQRVDALSQSRQRSEAKYEALLQLAPNAIFVVDADTGTIDTANERAASLSGYTESELHGMSVLELHPDDDRDRYARLLDDGFDERVQSRFDDGTPFQFKQSDGTEIPIELGISRVDLDDQTVLLAIVRDLTDYREREAELIRRRELFKQTQEAVGLGGWELDLDSMTGVWTDEIYRIFELPPATELTVSEAFDYFHPDDRQQLTDAFERLAAEGKPYDLELRLRTDEGTDRWVRTLGRPQYDDSQTNDGQPTGAIGIIWDITDRKERERDLRVKDQAIEESMVGITIVDATEQGLPIMYANTGFEEMTGYSKAYAMGKNCRFLQGEGTDDRTAAEIRRAIDAEESIQTEILNYRANGTPFWNELTVSPVMGADSREITHFIGVQNDVTAQKRRERLIEVLDRVLRHNLRNDMNVIIGFSDAIANRADGKVAQMAAQMKKTAMELISLSNKVRGFETGITEEKSLHPRNLREDIHSVIDGLRADYPSIDFEIEASGDQRVLATEQLMLAMSELGENATKYGNETSVCYELTTTAEGRVAIHVRDSGPGLPTTEQQVLELGRETPLKHGSGLGLWMVNWIVTGLGGDVTATVDDGTTVTITLPSTTDADTRRTSSFIDTAE